MMQFFHIEQYATLGIGSVRSSVSRIAAEYPTLRVGQAFVIAIGGMSSKTVDTIWPMDSVDHVTQYVYQEF